MPAPARRAPGARVRVVAALGVAAAILAACGGPGPPPPPGYGGTVPSMDGQRRLDAIGGRTFPEGDPDAGWTLGAFAVVPNPVSPGGKGPVVVVERGGERRYLRVDTDADVAALEKRLAR